MNSLTEKTKNVWIVLHGLGYLSRYFLKYFDELPPEENYIIAPQAPSKYYLNDSYRHVGASWLTKEDTPQETENIIAYLNAVIKNEDVSMAHQLIVFGFSQGVSIACRWVAHQKVKCSQLVLYAGGLPNELEPSDFEFLENYNTKITLLVGDADQYITTERLKTERAKIDKLFRQEARQIVFEGGHKVKKELINSLVQ